MLTVNHRITINSDIWSPAQHSRLLALRCHGDMTTPVNECMISMSVPKGISANPGDTIKVKLGYEKDLKTVFTGVIGSVQNEMDRLSIRATGAARRLLSVRLNRFFEKTAAGGIVSDICGQLEVPTGNVESGLDLSYYALGSNHSSADHIRYLAGLCGFDLFADENDRLVFTRVDGKEHPYQYGVNILALSLDDPAPDVSGVEIFGDSAAGKQGTDAAYWLSKAAVKGKAGDASDALQTLFVGAARTEEHAQKIAGAYLQALASKKTGTLKTLGAAAVRLGDTAKISKMPVDSQNGNFRVTGITHTITPGKGFTTTLQLESTEGGWSLSSLL